MNNLRSTLLVAVTAFVAAACGDKVTLAGPAATPAASVKSVTVAPASATLNIGDQITLTAAVNADAGLATTVTWKSSDASKASVDASGIVKGVAATPGVAICATSTVDTGKLGCASVIVTGAAAIVPATVSIASITTAGNLNAPVNPAAVAGTIDVKLNIAPGNQTPSRVDLLVGSTVVATQGFTATQAAALRSAADEAVAAQSAFPSVVLSFNTAAFNATTGVPAYLNGPIVIGAKLYTTQGGTTAAAANATTTLTLANADTYFATVATSGTTANALNGTGFRYDRGALSVSALPISYSGKVVASGTISFGSLACDAGAIGARSTALVAPAVAGGAWTGTLAQTGTAGAGNVNGYEFNGCVANNAIGETVTVTAVDSNGDALFTAAAPVNANAVSSLRLDNRAPTFPAGSSGILRINVNPNLRANGWVNDTVFFNVATTAAGATLALQSTSNGFICGPVNTAFGSCLTTDSLPRDAGVGSAAVQTRVSTTKTLATTATASATAAALAATATNAGYCAIAYSADALGNSTASPSLLTACGAEGNNTLIGVDRAAPTIAYTAGSIAANARLSGGTVGAEFQVTVNDTGLVGNSGMLPTNPVLMSTSRRAAGVTPNSAGTTTLFAADGVTAATAVTATGVAAAAPLYSTSMTGVTGAANYAYWTHNATAKDAAGNSVSISPRIMVYDATAPIAGAPSAPTTITAIGYSTTANISEDLDIQDYWFNATYTGAPVVAPAVLGMPRTAVNGFNAATFANTNYGVTTAVTLPLAIQANVGAGLTNLANLTTTARSQTNLLGTSGAFVPGVVTPGTGISLTNFNTFPVATLSVGTVTGLVTGNTTAASATGTPLATSTTVSVVATGTTAVFNNPFARVDLYMLDATGTRYLLVGSASTPTLNDNGATRTFTWSVALNGATVYGLLNGAGATFASQIVAIGVNANGNIGMVNAALLGINVVF